jgi:hypothetical protein
MNKLAFSISGATLIILVCAVSQPARADLKDNFKEGCMSGNGSYFENADGTVQCNSSGGVMIRCTSDISRCWIVASIIKNIGRPTATTLKNLLTQTPHVRGWQVGPVEKFIKANP